jgi:hypothetical protein
LIVFAIRVSTLYPMFSFADAAYMPPLLTKKAMQHG